MAVQNGRLGRVKFKLEYSEEKNLILKETRGVCFEDVVEAVETNKIIDDLKNRNHPNQRILVVRMKKYIYAVPYVVDREKKIMFLKTIYASRVLLKKYKKEAK